MVLLPCSKCCGPSEFTCLALSIHRIGRIIFEAQIENITPNIIDATYECGLWQGIRLRRDAFDITPNDAMTLGYVSPIDSSKLSQGLQNCADCGQPDGRGPSLISLLFDGPADADSDDPDYLPTVTLTSSLNPIVGRSLVEGRLNLANV